MKLEGGALVDPAFAEWAKDFVLFLHVTSRTGDEPHPNLLAEKGGQGFPYLVFMDAEGNLVGRHQGERSVAGFRKSGQAAREFLDLKAKAASGDADAQAGFFKAQLKMGGLTYAEASARFEDLGGAAKLGQESVGLLANLELQDAMKGARPNDPESLAPAARKAVEMLEAGRIPAGQQERMVFWQMVGKQAMEAKDAARMEKAVEGFRSAIQGINHPQIQQALKMMEGGLASLKEPPPDVDKAPGAPDTTTP